jgi:SNF2 family DNA or RNA helicase
MSWRKMDFKISPWEHQRKAIEVSKQVPSLGLFFETGTGKTMTAINILRWKFAVERRMMRTLIFGPLIVLNNWKREFAMHSKIDPRDILVLDRGAIKRRNLTLINAVEDRLTKQLSLPKIVLTNYEAVENDEFYETIKAWGPEVLICDESHRCKNPESKRAKKVAKLAKGIPSKLILTGTPILNTAADIFMQYLILDSGATFGDSYWAFKHRFFHDENAGFKGKVHYFPNWQPKPETYATFNKMIYTKALRAVKSECLDLPPLVKMRTEVELGPEQKKLYKDMEKDFIAFIQDHSDEPKAVVAQLAVTKALRLLQILSGYAKADDDSIHEIKDNPRLDALMEHLEDLTPAHKVLVWCSFRDNYAQIRKRLDKAKIKFVEIHGEIKQADRQAAIDSLNNDEETRVLLGHPGAGGIGISLTAASYSIYYNRTHSLEQDLQSEARNYRGGSERHEKITRIDIVAPGTIDEVVLEGLANKLNIAETILAHYKGETNGSGTMDRGSDTGTDDERVGSTSSELSESI